MTDREPSELASLLAFFHVCPAGLVAFDDSGEVQRANPAAVSLLLPHLGHVVMNNVFQAFDATWPELRELVVAATMPGRLVENHRVHFSHEQGEQWISATAVRMSDGRNMLLVNDVTDAARNEAQLSDLYVSQREALRRTELLAQNATHLAGASTVDEIAHSVLADLKAAMGLELATMNILDGDHIRLITSHAIAEERAALEPERTTDILSADEMSGLPGAAAIVSGEAIQIDSARELEARYPLAAERLAVHGAESLYVTPMRAAGGEVLGALSVISTEAGWIDASIKAIVATMAQQAGIAIERGLLFEKVLDAKSQEHEIAVRLQEALLPTSVISHPKLEIAASYRAAATLMSVGGDWYDTVLWPDGLIGAMVGDVAGHDIEAAVTMGRFRAAATALARMAEPTPIAVLGSLDRAARNPDGVDFVTAASLVIDPDDRWVSYSTAGHPPPLVVDPDGTTRWLDDANGPPVGLVNPGARRNSVVDVEPGSIVILYSDGLIERATECIDVGLARLASTAPNLRSLPIDQLPDALIMSLSPLGGPTDDVVVLAIRVLPHT